jgi:hypothetical protein
MHHLIYTSHAIRPFSDHELLELLKQSRTFNKSKGITGMLLYLQGKFIQVLEGQKNDILELYDRIKADPRHHRVSLIVKGTSPGRIFKGWSMGFRRLSYDDAEALGFKDIDNFFTGHPEKKEMSLLMVFLKLFYNKNMADFSEV